MEMNSYSWWPFETPTFMLFNTHTHSLSHSTHTHTHTHIYIYIYIYINVCVYINLVKMTGVGSDIRSVTTFNNKDKLSHGLISGVDKWLLPHKGDVIAQPWRTFKHGDGGLAKPPLQLGHGWVSTTYRNLWHMGPHQCHNLRLIENFGRRSQGPVSI